MTRPSLRQAPSVVVLAVAAGALAVVGSGHWRIGSGVLAVALLMAAGLRLLLPPARAGWLVVRTRLLDATLLLALGLSLLVLAATIPRPT